MGVGARTHGSEVTRLGATDLGFEVPGRAQQAILGGVDVADTSEPQILAPSSAPRSVAPTLEPRILAPRYRPRQRRLRCAGVRGQEPRRHR